MATASPDIATGVPLQRHNRFNLELTPVRIHALALNRWFQKNLWVAEGYPVPVIFATPMDAFSKFNLLWSSDKNPFAYLNDVNSPHVDPANPKFPLISVNFKSMALRRSQNYGSRTFRRVDWRTVSGLSDGLTKSNLGTVTSARYPQAWDFQYQIDIWTMRPDTQSILIDQVVEGFKIGGGDAQTFISVAYPGYMGLTGVRCYLNGDIQDTTEKDPNDSAMRYRTTFNLVLEGWRPDLDLSFVPTLWYAVFGQEAVDPQNLSNYYDIHAGMGYGEDLRTTLMNPVFNSRTNLPPDTPVPTSAPAVPAVVETVLSPAALKDAQQVMVTTARS